MGPELHVQLFVTLFLFGCGYALWRGDWCERGVAFTFVAAFPLSQLMLALHASNFAHPEIGVLAIDSVMLVIFLTMLVRSGKTWLTWMSGLQLLVVLSHFPILFRPVVTPEGYVMLSATWPWLMMVLLLGVTSWHVPGRMRQTTTRR